MPPSKSKLISPEDVEMAKATRKLKVGFTYYFDFFMWYFFCPAALGFALTAACSGFLYTPGSHIDSLLTILLSLPLDIILAYLMGTHLKRTIAFVEIKNERNLGLQELKAEIDQKIKVRDFYIDEDLKLIMILSKASFFSSGQVITIIAEDVFFLVNSRPTPTSGQPFSIYEDQKNINTIRDILRQKYPWE